MAFKTLFIAHTPDADIERDRCTLETKKYKLFVRLVSSQEQALEICKKLVQEEQILMKQLYKFHIEKLAL